MKEEELLRAIRDIGCRRSEETTFTVSCTKGGYRFEIYTLTDENPADAPRTAWSRTFLSRVYRAEARARKSAKELIRACREEFGEERR